MPKGHAWLSEAYVLLQRHYRPERVLSCGCVLSTAKGNNAQAEIVGRLIRQAMFLTTFVSVLQLIESNLFLL